MEENPTSITSAHTDSWRNPESLGFSTWQRHTGLNLSNRNSDTFGNIRDRDGDHGGQQGGLRAIYDRHASFASDLIARRCQPAESVADAGRFTYASSMNNQ